MSSAANGKGKICIPAKAKEFCKQVLIGHGLPDEDAQIVADSIIAANLRGLDSHGITRTGIYVERLKKNLVNPIAKIKILKDKGAMLHVDGDNGMGSVVTLKALQLGIERAKEFGSCSVGITHSNHYGAGAYYVREAVRNNLTCHLYGNAPPTMAPWGGIRPYLGTNPYSFGVPAGRYPAVILDMASSVVARGKIILAAKEGKDIPEGWAIDTQGKPTTNAQAALDGSVLPFAGPKGYGIALMNDIMGAILTSSNFGNKVPDLYRNLVDVQNIGAFIQLTDIASFISLEEFFARMEAMIGEIKAMKPAEGIQSIYLPGEIEEIKEKQRRKSGFAIAQVDIDMLNNLGRPFGLSFADALQQGEIV